MNVLIDSTGLVVVSSNAPITADLENDCFVSDLAIVYSPRPSSGVTVQEMDFPAESFQNYTMVNGVPTLTNPPPAIVPPIAQLIAANEDAIQNAMDALAQTRGYADIKSACAYASPNPVVPATNPNFAVCEKFRIEGNALQAWMAETWAEAYVYVASVKAGTNPMPTVAQAVAMMPVFTWPD